MQFTTLLAIASTLVASALASEDPQRIITYLSDIRYKNSTLIHDINMKKLMKRDDLLSVSSDIHQTLCTFPLYLGTPSQKITVVADTGSFKLWAADSTVFGSGDELCQGGSCFTASESSSYVQSNEDFSVTYFSDFGASGRFATDKLSLDGTESTTFKFGLASSYYGDNGGYSYAGLGYSEDYVGSNTMLVDSMVQGGLVDKRIVSFSYGVEGLDWGSDVMTTGTISFGGYDTTISDDIRFFDMNSKIDLSVGFNSVQQGSNTVEATGGKKILVDTGSTSLSAKQQYLDIIQAAFSYNSDYPSFITCSEYKDTTIEFVLDDNSTLSVPLLDLAWRYYEDAYDLCQLMIDSLSDSDSTEIIFGQYMVKNLATVIDIDSQKIAFGPRASGTAWK